MNLYLRYFDREVLVNSADEAIAFLADIDEIGMNQVLEKDVRDYVASNVMYPKRYKVRPRVYFIIIKTDAASMQDFKEKKAVHPGGMSDKAVAPTVMRLNEERFGWYEGTIDFKRVLMVPGTGKFQYRDTLSCSNKLYRSIYCYANGSCLYRIRGYGLSQREFTHQRTRIVLLKKPTRKGNAVSITQSKLSLNLRRYLGLRNSTLGE